MYRGLPERRPVRLRGHDYDRPGQYFVTIVVLGREELFGTVLDGEVRLSAAGTVVAETWERLPRHYPHILLDAFVVMPNHVHGIVQFGRQIPANRKRAPLPEIVRAFKTYSARRVNLLRGVSGAPVWQRNYYERIIRDDRELEHVRRYITENPLHWDGDPEKQPPSRRASP